MRRIKVLHTDFDNVAGRRWTDYAEGYLIDPRVILEADELGICFLLYDEPIGDDVEIVKYKDSLVKLGVMDGKQSVEEIDVEKLAQMTVLELGEYITGTK